jgi:hypothetical protein
MNILYYLIGLVALLVSIAVMVYVYIVANSIRVKGHYKPKASLISVMMLCSGLVICFAFIWTSLSIIASPSSTEPQVKKTEPVINGKTNNW